MKRNETTMQLMIVFRDKPGMEIFITVGLEVI